jgi:hypothetical protein
VHFLLRAASLDADLPIDLTRLNPLINRIVARYPTISKQEIIHIVYGFFSVLRSLLILENVITIHNLFNHLHIIKIQKPYKTKNHTMIKVKTNTPRIFNE